MEEEVDFTHVNNKWMMSYAELNIRSAINSQKRILI